MIVTTRQPALHPILVPMFLTLPQLVLNLIVIPDSSSRSGHLAVVRCNLTTRTSAHPAFECCLFVWKSLGFEQMVMALGVVLVGPKSCPPTHVRNNRQSTIQTHPSSHFVPQFVSVHSV